MRSSQPLMGANKKRCKEDEDLLQAVIEGSDKGYIIDTRSSQQAQQARMAGGGFESKSCYSRWKRLHRQMERCVSVCDLMLTVIFVILIHPKIDLHHVLIAGAKHCRRASSSWWKPAVTRPTTWTAGSVSLRIQSGCLTSKMLCRLLGCWQSVWRGMYHHLCTHFLLVGVQFCADCFFVFF